MTRTRARWLGRRGQAGTASVFVVGFAIVLLACAGLVIDGGAALNARMKLADDVEQAARAGADEIDVDALRSGGTVTLDRSAAEAAAFDYISVQAPDSATALANATSVTVTATDTVPTTMLQLVGLRSFDISASATAEAITQ